jgi:hypothetical protein
MKRKKKKRKRINQHVVVTGQEEKEIAQAKDYHI